VSSFIRGWVIIRVVFTTVWAVNDYCLIARRNGSKFEIIIYTRHLPRTDIFFKDSPIDRHLSSCLTILFISAHLYLIRFKQINVQQSNALRRYYICSNTAKRVTSPDRINDGKHLYLFLSIRLNKFGPSFTYAFNLTTSEVIYFWTFETSETRCLPQHYNICESTCLLGFYRIYCCTPLRNISK